LGTALLLEPSVARVLNSSPYATPSVAREIVPAALTGSGRAVSQPVASNVAIATTRNRDATRDMD
jgi:hypothetical protein